jgi:predicted outer membrane repeat protein
MAPSRLRTPHFTDNSATDGGAIRTQDPVTLIASIISANSGGDCSKYGTITDRAYNLTDDNGRDWGLTARTDILNTAPELTHMRRTVAQRRPCRCVLRVAQ